MNFSKRIILELTHKCNIRCNFCYLLSSNYYIESSIDLKDWIYFVKSFKYKTHFFLTGGEPLLYPHLAELLKTIKSLGHEVGINTNGLINDYKLWEKISSLPIDYVIFSLSYVKNIKTLVKNILLFNSLKSRITESIISTVLLPENISNLYRIYKIALRTKTDRFIIEHLQYYDSKKDAKIIMKRYKIDNFDFSSYFREILKILKSSDKIKVDIRESLMPSNIKYYYGNKQNPEIRCKNYKNIIVVQPNGTIRTCIIYPGIVGNIFNFKEEEILKKKNFFFDRGFPIYCYRCCHRLALKRIKN